MKTDRLVSMILLLLEEGRVSARELADRFEVSLRTVYRDMDAIGMAGIPLRSVPGAGGGFEIMEEYKLDHRVFTESDLSAILMGLTSLSGMVRGSELVNALAKVRSFIPADRAGDIEVRANQICIDLSPWLGNRNIQPYLELVKTALQENRLLSFAYTDGHGNRTVRTVEPYQLVLKGSHWYFQGYCRTREDYRLFRLSRMAELRMSGERFVPRNYQKPVLDFSEILNTMQTGIRLRVHRSVLDRVLEFCSEEEAVPDGSEHCIVRFPFIENDFYYGILLSLGDRCECLEPPEIREEMKRRIHALAAVYD